MNKNSASDFLAGIIDYVNKRPAIGWEAIQPVPKIRTFEDVLREQAIALWRKADDALEAGDVKLCHETQAAASLVEDFAQVRTRTLSPLQDRMAEARKIEAQLEAEEVVT